MARRVKSSIPAYKRKRKGRGFFGWLWRIILGVILLVLGFVLHIPILWTIGIILVVVGAILAILGATGRAVGGRKYWY